MREDQVYRMHEINTRRVMLLLEQFEFLNTRLMAMEEILFDRKLLWKAFAKPSWAKRVIDNKQKDLLAKAKAAKEKAMAKPIIKPVVFGGSNGKS